MSGEQMPKVDLKKDGNLMNKSLVDYMKLVEKENLNRVQKLKRLRRNNLITAFGLSASVLGIYGYSIYSVSQETFLDDFNQPPTEEAK
jgi:hypothetical protein